MSAHQGIVIRAATRVDAQSVAHLADGLRATVGDPSGHLTPTAILRDGFGERSAFDLLVAERGGALVGYALFIPAYEPAHAARGSYLADLYVVPEVRRGGVGRQLVAAVGDATRERGGTFVWWVAQRSNADALAFYARIGTTFTSEVVAHALVIS